mgnify:FL=1
MRRAVEGSAVRTDVLIVGGGCGGVGAALALASRGVGCVMTEPTAWVGGQMTSQGVPPDEHAWIEGDGPGVGPAGGFFGANRSYVSFRQRVRAWYRERGSLTAAAAAEARLNPGGGWVSRLCFEPRVGHAVLMGMLEEADSGRGVLTLLTGWEPVRADAAGGDTVGAVTVRERETGREVAIEARLVLDATEPGDVLELAGVEHSVGAEAQRVFDELHGRTDLPAGVTCDPLDQQACTWCLALEHDAAGEHVIEKPASYEDWRSFVPGTEPGWTGRLFSWVVPSHNEAGRLELPLVPPPDEPGEGALELWRYRRLVDASKHTGGRRDVTLVNVVQTDYFGGPLLGVSAAERERALGAAREQALSFAYWMQTESPRHDTGERRGYPGLRLAGDALGTADGLAMHVYVREPRRLSGLATLTEAHVGAAQRESAGVRRVDGVGVVPGEAFWDAVAVGHYPIDLHPSCAGRNSVYVEACPFAVPGRALVPRRVRNALAAGKCLSVSHVANGSTRLHPVEWCVGEAAGVLAAVSLRTGEEPAALVSDEKRFAPVRAELLRGGAELAWPWDGSGGSA